MIDEALKSLDQNIGYRTTEGLRISYLAFADDLILTAASPRGLQSQVNALNACLGCAGLQLNVLKCATMRIDIDGKRGTWVANPEAFLWVNGNLVTAINIVTSYKYLGLRTGLVGSHAEVKGTLSTGLDRLKRAPLKPQQRMYLLRVHLLPRLSHQLVLGEVSASTLECLDRMVRKAIREWLTLPNDTPKPFFHTSVRDGGLGISSIRQMVPVIRRQRLIRLANSSDVAIQWVAETPGFAQHIKNVSRMSQCEGGTLENTLECTRVQATLLHRTCDGRGLWQSSGYPAVNDWVTEGSALLTGGDFIQAIQVRGNLKPTIERSSRGRRESPPLCEAGCNAVCGLGHISQSCTRTHRLRSARHDSIVEFIRNLLEKRGNSVIVEPNIVTKMEPGNLIWWPYWGMNVE